MADARPSEPPSEWEGGDPPCWAHLFEDYEGPAQAEDDEAPAAPPATPTTGGTSHISAPAEPSPH